MKRYPIQVFIAAAGLLLATGCGGPPPEPAVVEIPGYEALQEQFTGRDMSPLRGRRIVLDPGHGGFFKGAVGQNGLTEAEVNLGVALYLRGLLEWVGAEVFLTRTADYDFLTANDSTLVSDLAFRSSFADSLQPDVFLSLHHNSVASLDRTVNETQTYYPLGADGASLDLARAIHRHLVINLEIWPAKILPGNFHVLRNATVPAVLGEPAMISNPVIEGRLKQASSQRLEAEAYFLGLLDYFSQGSPVWSGARLDTVFVVPDGPATAVSWTFFSEDTLRSSGPGPDPGTYDLKLDGRQVPFHVTGQGHTVNWYPAEANLDLPAVLELRGRNLVGRATPVRRTLLMPVPPRRVKLHLMPEYPNDDSNIALRWSVAGNAPLAKGRLVFSSDLALPLEGGTSGAVLLPLSTGIPPEVSFHPGSVTDSVLPCDIHTTELPAPWQWRLLVTSDGSPAGAWSLRTWLPDSLPAGMAAQDVPLIPYEPDRPVWVSIPGFLPLVDPDPANPDTARTISAGDRNWRTESIVPGLQGKVIVLDPAGGGSDPDGTGPLGMRGASLNLETALLAQGLLEGCGAVVHLTRRGETSLPAEEKIRLAGEVRADLFLTIGRSIQPDLLSASHHPGSETGQRWAELFLLAAAGLVAPNDSLAMTPSYDYLLRHTACPALEVRLPGPQSPRQEMRQSQRGWQRVEARAVLLSIASLFEAETGLVPTLDMAAVIADLVGSADLAEVDWAELDGNLAWSPVPALEPTGGGAEFPSGGAHSLDSPGDPGLPALLDRHTLEINAGDIRQLWLLERSGSGFSARLMMNNP